MTKGRVTGIVHDQQSDDSVCRRRAGTKEVWACSEVIEVLGDSSGMTIGGAGNWR